MAEKKRLHHFLNDMLKLSCVKGFKHFATHMRGREEMVCSIVNEPSIPIIQSATNSPATSFGHSKREAFPMSHKQQRRLSGYGFINVGLPPASPSENEEVDENQTMFLVAGYSRYNRPYVWVRTNHERLVRLSSEEEKDYPLLLQTTSQWQDKDTKVWDVLTELIEVCTAPCPPNPFAVDLDYFQSLQLHERTLASAAMIAFLQKLIASGPHRYDRKIHSDIGKISRVHFLSMLRMLEEGIIHPPSPEPPLTSKQHQEQDSLVAQSQHGRKIQGSGVTKTTTTAIPELNHQQRVSSVTVTSSSSLSSSSVILPQPKQTSLHTIPPHSTHASRPTPSQYTTGVSSTPTYPLPHSNVASRPTPSQYTVGVSSTPTYPLPQLQPDIQRAPTAPAITRPSAPPQVQSTQGTITGQFYSRRMGGSY